MRVHNQRINYGKRFLSAAAVCCLAATVCADPVQRTFIPVDLQPQGNRKLSDNQATGRAGTDLNALPTGRKVYGDVEFNVGEKLIQLGSTVLTDLPELVEGIEVGKVASKLHFLHATCFGGGTNRKAGKAVDDRTLIGEYRVNFADRTAVIFPIIYGIHVRDWFYVEDEEAPNEGTVVWEGTNDRSTQVGAKGIRIYLTSWESPWPDKKVTSIDYYSNKDETMAAPFCIAITIEGKSR